MIKKAIELIKMGFAIFIGMFVIPFAIMIALYLILLPLLRYSDTF